MFTVKALFIENLIVESNHCWNTYYDKSLNVETLARKHFRPKNTIKSQTYCPRWNLFHHAKALTTNLHFNVHQGDVYDSVCKCNATSHSNMQSPQYNYLVSLYGLLYDWKLEVFLLLYCKYKAYCRLTFKTKKGVLLYVCTNVPYALPKH